MANATSEDNVVRAANEAFYQALSAASIEGISAACAHDSVSRPFTDEYGSRDRLAGHARQLQGRAVQSVL